MKKLFYLLLLPFFLMSCSDNINNPEVSANDNMKNLKKTILTYEGSWPEQCTVISGTTYCYPQSTYGYTFNGLNFSLTYTPNTSNSTLSITISINGTLCSTVTYTIYPNPFNKVSGEATSWTNFHSFVYNGTTINIKFLLAYYNYPNSSYNEWPKSVFVQMPGIALDAPAGFDVNPRAHSNLDQDLTISWTASTDTDVTGYQIYRATGSPSGTYVLRHTVTSRTTNSWVDTTVNWDPPASSTGKVHYYKIRAVSSTLNIYSDFTTPIGSAYSELEP